jgi:hypothetical protein
VHGDSGFVVSCLGALVLATTLVACGEPDELTVREGEQTEAFCEASCTRGLECGDAGTLGGCQASCEAYVTGLENVRPEGVKIVAECILEISCSRFFDDQAFVPCWDRAEREIEPTESTRLFCLPWSTRWFECGYSYSIEQCESDWAINSGHYLERMLACVASECTFLESCAENVQSGGS